VLTTVAQGGDEVRVITVALGKCRATGEHDPGMTDVGASKFHLVLLSL
jgi:hypothetical protein